MPRPFFAFLMVTSLAACQPQGTDEAATPQPAETVVQGPEATAAPTAERMTPTPQATRADDGTCGADKVSERWLNALPTDDVKAEIAETAGERPIRYYTQGDPITMDFNPARLNVELGEDGRIKLFRCG